LDPAANPKAAEPAMAEDTGSAGQSASLQEPTSMLLSLTVGELHMAAASCMPVISWQKCVVAPAFSILSKHSLVISLASSLEIAKVLLQTCQTSF